MSVHRVTLSPRDVEEGFNRTVGTLALDKERGFNLWGGSEDPVMLVWSPRIYEFLQVLESTLSYLPARGFCREVGYRSGVDGAKVIMKSTGATSVAPVRALLTMPSILAGAGWGISELLYDEDAATLDWRFPRGTAVGVVAGRAGRRATPACAFFEGFGAGWVRGSLGLDLEMIEIDCIGKGDGACRFESRPLG